MTTARFAVYYFLFCTLSLAASVCVCVHAFASTNTRIHWTQFEYARTACALTPTQSRIRKATKSSIMKMYTHKQMAVIHLTFNRVSVCPVHHHTRYVVAIAAAAAIAVCSYISLSLSLFLLLRYFSLPPFVVSRLWRCYVVVYGFCLLLSMCARFKHNEQTTERQMYFDLIIFDGVSVALSDFYSIILPFVPTRATLYVPLCAHTAWVSVWVWATLSHLVLFACLTDRFARLVLHGQCSCVCVRLPFIRITKTPFSNAFRLRSVVTFDVRVAATAQYEWTVNEWWWKWWGELRTQFCQSRFCTGEWSQWVTSSFVSLSLHIRKQFWNRFEFRRGANCDFRIVTCGVCRSNKVSTSLNINLCIHIHAFGQLTDKSSNEFPFWRKNNHLMWSSPIWNF